LFGLCPEVMVAFSRQDWCAVGVLPFVL
jgi:hypothetical protein